MFTHLSAKTFQHWNIRCFHNIQKQEMIGGPHFLIFQFLPPSVISTILLRTQSKLRFFSESVYVAASIPRHMSKKIFAKTCLSKEDFAFVVCKYSFLLKISKYLYAMSSSKIMFF